MAAKTQTRDGKKEALGQFLSEIEKRAYEIYLLRMAEGRYGSDLTDWLEAESDVKAKYKLG